MYYNVLKRGVLSVKFDIQMTIAALVDEMNNGGNQNELYKASKIKKDLLPYLFRAAGYTREKQKYVPTDNVQASITIEKLLPLAKALHQETKSNKPQKTANRSVVKSVVVEAPIVTPVANVSEYSFNFANKADMQRAILDVLDLNTSDLEAIRALKGATHTNTIYEAISKLQSRQRSNKTYYISNDIAQQVQAFTESKTIKVSQFVEVALIEAMRKYDK